MRETILITSATGTVGSEAVKILSENESRIRAGVHSLIKGDRFRSFANVDLVHLDFKDPESLKVNLTGVTRAFLITPFVQDQVAIAKNFIQAAKDTGLKHIVRLSASGADAQPGIQLGREHREVEVFLESSGLTYTILRPTSFMQNFLTQAAESIRNKNSIYMPAGHGLVSYIDARDIAAVAEVVLTQSGHENKIYELTGPEAISVNDVAHALTVATDRVITYVDVPEEAAAAAMQQKHLPEWKIKALMELNGVYKAGYAAKVTDTVERLTGSKPRSIVDFAQEHSHEFLPQ
jgi:uncharacterized protein YbjT (DUF2867 family)